MRPNMREGAAAAAAAAVLVVLAAAGAAAYNDEAVYYKWAPQALYRGSYRPRSSPSYYGGGGYGYGSSSAAGGWSGSSRMRSPTPYLRSRYDSGSFFPRPESRSAALRDNSEKRTESFSQSGCMSEGQVCLFRSGLVGAVMKLPCCQGATCTLLGAKFVCVDDQDLGEMSGGEAETVDLDPSDLAGWNQEIFGRK